MCAEHNIEPLPQDFVRELRQWTIPHLTHFLYIIVHLFIKNGCREDKWLIWFPSEAE